MRGFSPLWRRQRNDLDRRGSATVVGVHDEYGSTPMMRAVVVATIVAVPAMAQTAVQMPAVGARYTTETELTVTFKSGRT